MLVDWTWDKKLGQTTDEMLCDDAGLIIYSRHTSTGFRTQARPVRRCNVLQTSEVAGVCLTNPPSQSGRDAQNQQTGGR